MSIFETVGSASTATKEQDTLGYISALLNDIPNEGEGVHYDDWLSIISLLKYELSHIDEEIVFEIFDQFSSQSDIYDEQFTYKKFYESQFEGTGQIKLGTLVHIAKRDVPNFDPTKYKQFWSSDNKSQITKFTEKLEKSKNKKTSHFLQEQVDQLTLPSNSVDATIALTILLQEDKTYGTAKEPYNVRIVDPYKGDTLEQYITVNPIENERKQKNVTDFRHAVLEFDTISLDDQFSIFSAVDLPYEALVFTGNKSIHAWVRIDAPDNDVYKERTRLLNKMFEDFGYSKKTGNGLDTAVLYDSSSLVRTPAGVRQLGDGAGNLQRVIWAEESEGWDHWYNNVYPKYIVDDDQDDEEVFEIPERNRNFNRKKKRIDELLEDDYELEIKTILEQGDPNEIESILNNAVPQFAQNIFTKSHNKITPDTSDLYYLLENAVLEGGHKFEGDLREVLYKACTLYDKFVEERAKARKDKLEKAIEHVEDQINEYVDPVLIEEIDRAIDITLKSEKPDDFEKMVSSVKRMFEDLDYRPAIFQHGELYKYSIKAGRMLADEFVRNNHLCKGALYVYYEELHAFEPSTSTLRKVDVQTFPSYVTPYLSFVKKTKQEFRVVPLDNDTAGKLLKSGMFLSQLRTLELISDVPIFKEVGDQAELVTGYDADKKALVTGDVSKYDFMELDEAVKIIKELFIDFSFVDQSDLSRAIGSLITPAMCHADMLKGDYRPLVFIDADYAGAGKGTLVNTLVIPYTDHPALVTQDDSSIGSIDDKVGNAVMEGHNLIVVDNLKPTYKMKELSSAFLEGMITSEAIGFRSAGQRHKTLKVDNTCMYLTTNGMPLSKDLADRSLYISIRKRDVRYDFKYYEQGHKNYLIENRPRVMSAIYTVLREYVKRGKPEKKADEGHRFLKTVPIINYIVTEIFELPDITTGTRQRTIQKADKNIDAIRGICFAVATQDKMKERLTSIDIFEILSEEGSEYLLNISPEIDIYSDEFSFTMNAEAKRAIGQSVSRIFSRPNVLGRAGSKKETKSCKIEEFIVTRHFDSTSKSAVYEVNKDE